MSFNQETSWLDGSLPKNRSHVQKYLITRDTHTGIDNLKSNEKCERERQEENSNDKNKLKNDKRKLLSLKIIFTWLTITLFVNFFNNIFRKTHKENDKRIQMQEPGLFKSNIIILNFWYKNHFRMNITDHCWFDTEKNCKKNNKHWQSK